MSNPRDGGWAFPRSPMDYHKGGYDERLDPGSKGMSLRDYFAGQALVGILCERIIDSVTAARTAYEFADAMLQERERQP